MIKNLYIMTEKGVLLYSKTLIEEKKYDENILIGFFASLTNFSREALNSVIKNIDLGDDNKLILHHIPKENLIGAAIVSAKDNNELVTTMLNEILQEFIGLYSPVYNPERVDYTRMDTVVNNNLAGRVNQDPLIRIIISAVLIVPLSFIFAIISMSVVEIIFIFSDWEQLLYSGEEIVTTFMPIMFFLGSLLLIFSFPLANFLFGYISVDRRIEFIEAVIYMIANILWYFFYQQPAIGMAIVSNIPIALVISMFFASIGHRLATKKRLFKA